MGTLTNAAVRDAKPRAKVYELTCAGLPGFVLRILPTGKKVFVVRHRMHGQDCRVRLGLWSATFTVEEARRRAAVLLGGGELDVPASAHESLTTGQWDVLGQLLEAQAGIKGTATKLPYMSGYQVQP